MPNSGGYGDPLERDPDAVLSDVLDGFTTVELAERDYGVVIDPETMTRRRRGDRQGAGGGDGVTRPRQRHGGPCSRRGIDYVCLWTISSSREPTRAAETTLPFCSYSCAASSRAAAASCGRAA